MSKYEIQTLDGDTLGSGSMAEHVDLLIGHDAPREVVVLIKLGIPFTALVKKPDRQSPEQLTVQMASYERVFVNGKEPRNVKSLTPGTSVLGAVEGILIYFGKKRFITLYPRGDARLVMSPHMLRASGTSIADFVTEAETAVHNALCAQFENR